MSWKFSYQVYEHTPTATDGDHPSCWNAPSRMPIFTHLRTHTSPHHLLTPTTYFKHFLPTQTFFAPPQSPYPSHTASCWVKNYTVVSVAKELWSCCPSGEGLAPKETTLSSSGCPQVHPEPSLQPVPLLLNHFTAQQQLSLQKLPPVHSCHTA